MVRFIFTLFGTIVSLLFALVFVALFLAYLNGIVRADPALSLGAV